MYEGFTPEVLFGVNIDTIFDTDAKDWDEPSEEQKEDEEQDPSILRKKLHIQQVRSLGDRYTDVAFICSKKDIKRDYVVFLSDTTVYGDTKHCGYFYYKYILKHLGKTIVDNSIGIAMIMKHNRDLLDRLPIEIRNNLDNADEIMVGIECMPDRYKRIIAEVLNALIYTEDDILII